MVWAPTNKQEALVVVVERVDYTPPKPLARVSWNGYVFWVLLETLKEVGVLVDEKK
jgi:hypothetical protein